MRLARRGEDRLTWQPEPGVRSATVVVHYQGAQAGFVMAGRSLREVGKSHRYAWNHGWCRMGRHIVYRLHCHRVRGAIGAENPRSYHSGRSKSS